MIFYRKMKSRMGPEKAITPAAHKLARIMFHMVTTGDAYDESVFAKAQEKFRIRQECGLRAGAKRLGFKLVPINQVAWSQVPAVSGSLEGGLRARRKSSAPPRRQDDASHRSRK